MSQTLGEKLRQAREDRGISLSEVAEHTRISSLYISSIEKDDYKPLPGGIFNKGFIKSYARYIGIDEQEALQDYAELFAASNDDTIQQPRSYRPEVLTDERPISAQLPTIIIAAVILALMTAGILFAVNYLRNREPAITVSNSSTPTPAQTNIEGAGSTGANPAGVSAPQFENAKFELRAVTEPIWLSHAVDKKRSQTEIRPEAPMIFEPKESLALSYHRSKAAYTTLAINGKPITLPSVPLNPRRSTIDVEINKSNFTEIWQSGQISDLQTVTSDQTATPANIPARPARPVLTRPVQSPPAAILRPATNTLARPTPN
ncbi:MAG: helix-turn-helix domain-containing protein [Acidobacteria bacterium]|nr:helix-turn-helix domain-containing protein [Acidobacteriota bacterium]